jgi:hypothetical protein
MANITDTPPPFPPEPTRFDPEKFGARLDVIALPPFDLGKLFGATFALIKQNWLFLVVVGLCVVVLPKLAMVGAHLYFHAMYGDEESAYKVLNMIVEFYDYAWSYLLQIAVVVGLTMRTTGIGLAPAAFISVITATVLITLLSTIGTVIGLFLLVIPGLLLLVRWSLAGPALVVERIGTMQSMGRSAALTRGYFWPIFGALIVCTILSSAWAFAYEAFGAALLGIWPDHHVDWLIESLCAPWVDLVYGVITVALYVHIVELKEGGSDATIADVFD